MEPDMDLDMDMDAATDDMGDMGADIPPAPDMGVEEPSDVEVDDDEEEEEETVDEAYGETKGGNASKKGGKHGQSAYGATGTDTGDSRLHEGAVSRMQKLANIRK